MNFHIFIMGYLLRIQVLPLCEAHLMIRFLLSSCRHFNLRDLEMGLTEKR